MVLDEYFASIEFVSGGEAGAEFGVINSASSNSLATSTSTIPVSHQLNSASPFVDSGVDLNVMGFNQGSIDNDDVFVLGKNGELFHLENGNS